MKELAPCPFCGCKNSKDKLHPFVIPKSSRHKTWYEYKCGRCKTQFILEGESEEEVIKLWNSRKAEVTVSCIHCYNEIKMDEAIPTKVLEEIMYLCKDCFKYNGA